MEQKLWQTREKGVAERVCAGKMVPSCRPGRRNGRQPASTSISVQVGAMGASTHAAVHCHSPPGGCALPLIPLFRAGAVGGAAGATQLASRPYIAHIGLTLAGLGAEEESKKKKKVGRARGAGWDESMRCRIKHQRPR